MNWFRKILFYFLQKRLPKIEYFMKYPHEVQEKTFHQLIQQAKDTQWGRIHDYKNVKNYYNFQQNVSLSSYEEIFPYIERMLRGEQNVLWPSPIYWFSKSSGTTNARSKFIPVSKEALQGCHFMGGRDVIALYIQNRPKTNFFLGRGMSIGGSIQPNEWDASGKSFYGDISGVITKNLPMWAQWLRTPPVSVALMSNWEEKIAKMAELSIGKNITSILGVPTWTVVLMQYILERTGKKHILEVWKNFEVFVHGAVAFKPYKPMFQQLLPSPDVAYMETYNASEGFFGIQDDLTRDDMLLMLDYGVFYEFIPLAEIDSPSPPTYTIWEVELNKNYAMVISSNTGLWRYKIGDTVKFTSKNPYRIKITGRTKHYINAFGEEVIIENAETAVSRACEKTGAVITNFTACPMYLSDKNKGGHEWIIEFAKMPSNLQVFTEILDSTLREINSDYDAKRYKDLALQMPVIHAVPEGTFYRWLKKRGKLGGQNKVPRLANDREYVEDILQLLATEEGIGNG
ncbi:MAG: GH3 auxin-responsive promoter family protein [Microscillaceae bacterium]|nr:GH3 auxin-responsive promoter family protein [Microscillaceae bacterium]MDW8460277.1 GH3 auxin-responsive promoter family protein [Cytophagales bacterium]